MTYAAPIQTSVNSGELSPRMTARVDFDRYRNACARARNIILLPTGGFTKCPGTRYVGGTYDQTKVGRLIPFKFSQTDAYIIEMSENIARLYRRQARLTCEDVGASITNGTFTSNITGWDDVGAGTPSYSSGRLQLGQGSDEAYSAVEQDVTTTTTSAEHVLAFKVIGAVGAKVRAVVGSSSDSDDIYTETEFGTGWHVISFTPGASPFYFGIRSYTDETIYIDDVSLLDNTDLTLAHDYSESELPDLRWVQTADVLYLFHPSHPTRKFSRRGHRDWSLETVAWEDGPYNDPNEGFDYTLTQLIKNPNFEDGLRHWDNVSALDGSIEWDASQNIVVMRVGNNANEDARIEQQVSTGASGSNVFVLHFQFLGLTVQGSLQTLQIGTTSGATDIQAATEYEQGWHSIKVTSSDSTWYIRSERVFTPSPTLPVGGLGGMFLYRQDSHLLELSDTEGDVTCTAYGHSPFASTDVGRLIRLTWPGKEPAWGVITTYSSATSVTVRLRRKAPYASVPTENWQLGTWSETDGYPEIGGFFQSRLIAAKSSLHPLTLWFTQTGDLENMRPDSLVSSASVTEDDDALTYLIASEEVNAITWLAGRRRLIIGTSGGQLVASSQGAALTATDISIEPHADVPCKNIGAVATQSALVFIEESGTQIHDLGFSFEQDSFLAADLTIIAEHMINRQKAEEIALQRRPFQSIWARRDDGRLGILAYNRSQDIVGWVHRILGGSFSSGNPVVESHAIIPGRDDSNQVLNSGERDEIWIMVKRTVDGSTVRYIEVFEQYYEGPVREEYDSESDWEAAVKADMVDAFYVDSGATYDGSATDTVTGADHLEGQTVSILADGKVHAPQVVSSGSFTLEYEAEKIQYGLPIPWSFESLKLPFGTQSGSGVGKLKGIPAVGLTLLDAGIFSFGIVTYDEEEGRVVHGLQELTFLRDGLNYDEAIPLFTGEVVRNLDGATRRDVRVYLEGDDPLPFTMLAMTPQMMAGER